MRTSSSHQEGCKRRWCILTKELTGDHGRVSELHGVEVDWEKTPGGFQMKERPGTEFSMKADLVLLAMGFVHVEHGGLVDQLGVELDRRGNVVVKDYMSSQPGVFAAGDTHLGATLIVRAINAGREAADAIDRYVSAR